MVRGNKRVAFADDDETEREPDEAVPGPSTPFGKKFKHTLDSDEEDDEEESEKYNIDSDDVEGEEDGEERQEADVKITPFNMKAELEEGHIDKSGMYIFDKKKGQVRDNWLDSLENVKVYERQNPNASEKETEDDSEPETSFDAAQCYREILSLMQGDETVQKAIQRMGKKSKQTKDKIDKDNLMKLISSADSMISAGDMDIYGRTVSQLQYKLKEATKESVDIFADEEACSSKNEVQVDEVSWVYKLEDKEDAEIHGPFSTNQMIEWTRSGHFKQEVFVRQSSKHEAPFYSCKRVDFELYS